MNETTAELLPCPFCGEQPDRIDEHRVQCCNDQCGNYIKMMNIQDWNTRTGSTSQIAALRSALERALEMVRSWGSHRPSTSTHYHAYFADIEFLENALAAAPADPVREAATALVAKIDLLSNRFKAWDAVAMDDELTALKTALEAK